MVTLMTTAGQDSQRRPLPLPSLARRGEPPSSIEGWLVPLKAIALKGDLADPRGIDP